MRRGTMTPAGAGLLLAWAVSTALGQGAGAGKPGAPATTPAPATAKHGDHAAGYSHGRGMDDVEPTTYGEALRRIGKRISIVQSLADAGKWGETHPDAETIASVGKLLGKLALAKDSGVARPAVKDVNIGGKALAEAANAMRDAADTGKADEAAGRFERVKTVFGEISKAAPAEYALCVTASGEIKAGAPAKLAVALRDPAGATVQGLDVVHEQPVHVIVAAGDLSWYRHEHPARQADGSFVLEITPPQPGAYAVFADFTPSAKDGAKAGNQVARATMTVAGSPPFVGPVLKIDAAEVKQAGGLDVRLRCNGGYHAREDTVIRYNFQQGGKDVTDFERYLGAPAYLVIISADGRQYVRAQPVERGDAGADALFAKAASYNNGKDTDLVFHAVLPMSGLYRAFLEFKRGGQVFTVPFTIEALAPDAEHEHDNRTEAPRPSPAGAAQKRP